MKNIFYLLIALIIFVSCKADEKKETSVEIVNDEIYSGVNDRDLIKTPALYIGGMDKFYQFLGDNIKYPIDAIENDIQGNVRLSFNIGKDGSLSNIKVLDTLGFGLDEEAIRVLKLSKKWKPAVSITGEKIATTLAIPIKFSLTE